MPAIHIKRIPVEENSIDIHRHVNNQEYLRWMQDIAIEHSSLRGWPMERYLQGGASWYVKSHFIEYLRPALLGDTLLACTWVAAMGERSSPRKTLFLRASDRVIVARAETEWIFVSLKNGRPKTIPPGLRSTFQLIATETEAVQEIERLLAARSTSTGIPKTVKMA